VSKKNNKNNSLDDYWDEVFDDIEVRSVPVEYLESLNIRFVDGRTWSVLIDKKKNQDISIEESIEQLLNEYEDEIESVDFKVDTEKVKKDINKRTKSFLKKGR